MKKQFITGPDVNPFYKASQVTIDMLEGASAATLALAVPYVKFTQIDPYTGQKIPDVSFTMDITSPPGFGRPTRDGSFLERPLVSLDAVSIVYEAITNLECKHNVALSFTVHDPYTVFFDDNAYSSFRAILQEGNAFLLEYGWTGNCDNDLLNGLGFYDDASGFVVPAIKRFRILMYSWKSNLSTNGELKLTVDCVHDGEAFFREAKLSKYLDLAGIEENRRKARKSPRASLPNAADDTSIAISALSIMNSLPVQKLKPHNDVYKVIDVLNAFVAPMLEKAFATAGYSDIDMFLGNFSPRCSKTVKSLGSRDLAGKSIGEAFISVKEFKKTLGVMHANGETTVTINSFLNAIVSILNSGAGWEHGTEAGKETPVLFVGTNSVPMDGGKTKFVLFIADSHFSTVTDDAFIRENKATAAEKTREATLKRIRDKGIPILQFGKAGSILKDCSMSSVVTDKMRGMFVDNKFKDRKSQVEKTSAPDTRGRQGASKRTDYVFFTGVQAEITMLGNFIFSWGQTIWLDIMSVDPMSGFYDVVGIDENITSAGFVTKLKLTSRGHDAKNVRGLGLTRKEQEQEKLDREIEIKNQEKIRARKAKKPQNGKTS